MDRNSEVFGIQLAYIGIHREYCLLVVYCGLGSAHNIISFHKTLFTIKAMKECF